MCASVDGHDRRRRAPSSRPSALDTRERCAVSVLALVRGRAGGILSRWPQPVTPGLLPWTGLGMLRPQRIVRFRRHFHVENFAKREHFWPPKNRESSSSEASRTFAVFLWRSVGRLASENVETPAPVNEDNNRRRPPTTMADGETFAFQAEINQVSARVFSFERRFASGPTTRSPPRRRRSRTTIRNDVPGPSGSSFGPDPSAIM